MATGREPAASDGPIPDRSILVGIAGVVSLTVLTVIYLAPVHAKLAEIGYPPESFGLRYLAATVLGGAIGLAELALRYRDEPSQAASSGPGLVFVLLNGAAAALALFFLEYFGARPRCPARPPRRSSKATPCRGC